MERYLTLDLVEFSARTVIFRMSWGSPTAGDTAMNAAGNGATPRSGPVGKGANCDAPRKSYRSHRARLRTVQDISAELAKLYREARANKVDTADASRLANMLSIAARLLTESDLERRLEALEAQAQ